MSYESVDHVFIWCLIWGFLFFGCAGWQAYWHVRQVELELAARQVELEQLRAQIVRLEAALASARYNLRAGADHRRA